MGNALDINTTCMNVDFLPASYRQESTKRRISVWRLLVIALFGGAVSGTAMFQFRLAKQVEISLANVETQYAAAMAETKELADIQSKLAPVRMSAELLTYLRHPWPRTQVLSALMTPLPSEISLESLNIGRQQKEKLPNREENRVPTPAAANDKLPPPARDLQKLRSDNDDMQVVVTLSGIAADEALLHSYLGKLGQNKLFLKVQLGSIEVSSQEKKPVAKFTARLIVRPGYGQPGGPVPTEAAIKTSPAESTPKTALIISSERGS